MKNNPDTRGTLNTIVKETQKIETNRKGWITKVDEKNNAVWVDYENNPSASPQLAQLSNPWITLENLKMATKENSVVQIDFENGDASKPVIRDLFYSITDVDRKPIENRVIRIEAEEIILSGRKRVVIQSGNAKTTYIANGGELIEEADQIDSSADLNYRIKGGTVLIN